MNFILSPAIIFLLLLQPGLVFLIAYFIYLAGMYRSGGNYGERFFTVGPKALYDWDPAALILYSYPQLLYKPIEDPPEYSETGSASPLPAYNDVLYSDQLIRSFSLILVK